MKLSDLIDKYGDWHVDLKNITGNSEIESFTIDLTKPEPKTVWNIKYGNGYWYIGFECLMCYWTNWMDNDKDKKRLEIGNVFLTREDAEREVERRKLETLLLKYGGRKWFNEHNYNYHVGLDEWEEHLKVYFLATPTQGMIYFDTKEQAEKAISIIGEQKIKETLFEVR